MEGEFGTGLRAHLGRIVAPALEPTPEEEAAPDPVVPAGTGGVADLEERERMLVAAGAELAYRERRLLEREVALVVAAQKVAAEVVARLLEVEAPVEDELALARARRHGSVA